MLFCILTLIPLIHITAQNNYEKQWDKIDALIKEQSFKTAYNTATELTAKAKKERLSTEMLIGTMYINLTAKAYQEDVEESGSKRYEELLPFLNETDKMVCHSLLAKQYNNYEIRYLTEESERKKQFEAHRSAALSNPALLQRTKAERYKRLCTIIDGDKKLMITPTLYDILVRNEVEMCDNENEKLQWIERLLDFHKNYGNEELIIYLEKERLEQQDRIPNGTKTTDEDWERLIEKHADNKSRIAAQVYLKLIERKRDNNKMQEAIDLCDKMAKHFENIDEVKEAKYIKQAITAPHIETNRLGIEPCERDNMTVVTVRNVTTLYCRIVACTKKEQEGSHDKSFWLKKKAIAQWSQATQSPDDYKDHKIYCYLPSLPTGSYMLLLSPTEDFLTDGFCGTAFDCSDATFVAGGTNNNALRSGYLIDQTTGRPIANQAVILEHNESRNIYKEVAKTTTDNNGWFEFEHFPENSRYSDYYVSTDYNGYKLRQSVNQYRTFNDATPQTEERYTIMLDRPVYKPGEEIQFALIAYESDHWHIGKTLSGKKIILHLKDLNYKTVDTIVGATDAYGRMSGTLRLPEGCLPGNYYIVEDNRKIKKSVLVEAYKQPTFAVNLWSDENDYQFGREAKIAGNAVSYSGVPLNNAKVTYSVERRQRHYWWRWWNNPSKGGDIVASGETTIDGEGHFNIAFTPEPDSSVELTRQTAFIYTLRASVTDLNGETHEQSLAINVGYSSGSLIVMNDEQERELTTLKFQYLNLDGNPVADNVRVVVERLDKNSTPLLRHRYHDSEALHTLGRDEFGRRYAGMAYSANDLDPDKQKAVAVVFDKTVSTTQEQAESSMSLPRLADGTYRIRLTCTDKNGETIEGGKTIRITTPAARECQSDELIWSDIDRAKAEIGESVKLRIGTRHKDITAIIAISDGNGNVERRQIFLSNEMKSIDVKVSREMLGGLTIDLLAMKEGVECSKKHSIEVPFNHKRLQTKLETFHDKLRPGANEEWTLRISDADGRGVEAATVMTMYDAALDNYGSLSWSLWPWRSNTSQSHLHHEITKLWSSVDEIKRAKYFSSEYSPEQWFITDNLYIRLYTGRNRARYSKSANLESMSLACAMSTDADYKITANGLVDIEEASVEASIEAENEEGATKQEEKTLRDNLNTLAFFYPTLLSDKDGKTTIHFTAPDLLTEWNLHGIAYTTDIKVGKISEKVVTQKELMVMPMIPRFFRQGDHAVLSVKVANLTDKEQQATVRLTLADGESQREWGTYKPQTITVPAKGSAIADFDVDVPRWSYAVVYTITAENQQHRDGEQNAVAVLSNRQMVTESQAMYVNGRGEKRYTLSTLPPSDTREMRLMAVEFTANPIWLAIQSLPYVAEHENPSNIYLFNKYYCNSVANRIVADNSAIEQVFAQWKADTTNTLQSRLMQNSDLKQTLMEETPWLQCAESETQNMHEIANYFDRSRIDRELMQVLDKIVANQRNDGGFSWMPDGEWSSEYTTRYLLRVMASLNTKELPALIETLKRAMNYVDSEVADYYEKYIKKEKIKDAMDVGFLYIHSCYPDLSVSKSAQEAYNYYMANAKRNCLTQSGLYYRAMLALVMNRSGEKDLAKKLIRQLKECSLVNDEMGMYWRDNVSGYFWTERPIEVQSFLIKAFGEVEPNDKESVGLMRQWLLKQKQTTSWNSDIASVSAIDALLSDGKPLTAGTPATLTVGTTVVDAPSQAGTGYVAQRWTAAQIKPDMTSVTIRQKNESIGWGAAYWQYVEDIDKIPASDMGIALKKSYLLMHADGTYTELKEGDQVKIGDRMKVQIAVSCDRNLEFVELKEGRPAGFEPVSSASGWRWSEGLSYYMAVTNTAMHCYIDRLDKGKYVISYDLFATQAGTFTTGLSMMQSLYAPEFRSKTQGRKITVRK